MRNGGEGPPFPVTLLMGAVREVGAELVITRRPLVGNREADSTRATMALAGPAACEQIEELIRSKMDVTDEQQTWRSLTCLPVPRGGPNRCRWAWLWPPPCWRRVGRPWQA
eukprot:4209644-Pyramimonas_sp.AAC.1